MAHPRIYAYSIADKAHAGLLKLGQTTRNVQSRARRATSDRQLDRLPHFKYYFCPKPPLACYCD